MSDNSMEEFVRIHVPHPDTELVLGIRDGNTNFSGIMGRVADGGVFLGAGGYPGGIPSASSSYDGFKKAHTTLAVAVSGLTSLALVFRSAFLFTDVRQGAIDALINTGVFIGAGVSGAMAGLDHGTAAARGNISLYGDSGIALASPLTVSLTAGVSGSVNALLASVNGVVSASVNALLASVNGTIAASVNGALTSVTGDIGATLASRSGEANVLGKLVNIGKATAGDAAVGLNAALGVLLGKQKPTRRVDVQADQHITLEAGTMVEKMGGATGVNISTESVRVHTKTAAVTVMQTARLQSGPATVMASSSGACLAYLPVNPVNPFGISGVMAAHETAIAAAQKAYNEYSLTSDLVTTGLVVGGVTAAAAAGGAAGGVGIGAAADQGAGATAGISTAVAAVGGALGGATAAGVLWLVKKVLAGKTLDAAKLAADTARKTALAAVTKLEEGAAQAGSKLPPAAVVETGPAGIKLAYMGSQIMITAAGIDIKTPGVLTLNGTTISTTGTAATSMT